MSNSSIISLNFIFSGLTFDTSAQNTSHSFRISTIHLFTYKVKQFIDYAQTFLFSERKKDIYTTKTHLLVEIISFKLILDENLPRENALLACNKWYDKKRRVTTLWNVWTVDIMIWVICSQTTWKSMFPDNKYFTNTSLQNR